MKGIVRRVRCPTLVLVRQADLVDQLYESFSDQFDPEYLGRIRGGVKEPDLITFATVQSAAKINTKFFKPFGCLLFDECDEATSKISTMVVKRLTGAYYRVGLSGTALKKNKIRNQTLFGLFGLPLITVEQKELVERGISCGATIDLYKIKQPRLENAGYDHAIESGIVRSKKRNRRVVEIAIEYVEEGRSVFVVVEKRAHGQILKRRLKEAGLRVVYIHGDIPSTKRWSYYKRFGSDIDVIVGTRVLNRGLNLPAVSGLINAAGGYADTQTLQRLGRGLRAKDDPLEPPLRVADFLDEPNEYLRLHSSRRKRTYKKEGAFKLVVHQ